VIVTIRGTKYNIFWRYLRLPGLNTTVCVLALDGSTKGQCLQASAACHPGDVFAKEMGRRVSLARLLRRLESFVHEAPKLEMRAIRTEIWKAYWNRLPVAKRPKSAQKEEEVRFAASKPKPEQIDLGGDRSIDPDGEPAV